MHLSHRVRRIWHHRPSGQNIFVRRPICFAKEQEIGDSCPSKLGADAPECQLVDGGVSDELKGAAEAGRSTAFISGVMPDLRPEKLPERVALSDYYIRSIPEVFPLSKY